MKRLLVVVTCALLVSCGSGGNDSDDGGGSAEPVESTTSAAPTSGETTTGVEGGEVADAAIVAEFFANTAVEWGEQAFDLASLAEGAATVYPDLTLSGSAVPADPTTVSATATVVDDKASPAADNPGIVAFAVRDTGDQCIGVAVVGHPAPTEVLHFEGEAGDECTAQEMADAARTQVEGG